jgi:hypothetical protein
MRPYFGQQFKPSSGFDLRYFDQWSPHMKAKITKYWRVIAPQVARPHKARYFRRPDHLEEAIAYTQQEAFLPGQTAALFAADEGEALDIKFARDGTPRVKRQNISVEKVYFNLHLMFADPEKAIREALDQLPPGARRYKIMMGPHESRSTLHRGNIVSFVMRLLEQYGDDERYDPDDERSSYFEYWMLGLVGYYGSTLTHVDTFLEAERESKDIAQSERRARWIDIRRAARKKAKGAERKKKKGKKKKRKPRKKRAKTRLKSRTYTPVRLR